jgi:hypothetical protein
MEENQYCHAACLALIFGGSSNKTNNWVKIRRTALYLQDQQLCIVHVVCDFCVNSIPLMMPCCNTTCLAYFEEIVLRIHAPAPALHQNWQLISRGRDCPRPSPFSTKSLDATSSYQCNKYLTANSSVRPLLGRPMDQLEITTIRLHLDTHPSKYLVLERHGIKCRKGPSFSGSYMHGYILKCQVGRTLVAFEGHN